MHHVLECGRRLTPLGETLRIQIHRDDLAPMPWREVWDVFAAHYPGKWGVQLMPPARRLLDQANKYHVHVFDQRPAGLDLIEAPAAGVCPNCRTPINNDVGACTGCGRQTR